MATCICYVAIFFDQSGCHQGSSQLQSKPVAIAQGFDDLVRVGIQSAGAPRDIRRQCERTGEHELALFKLALFKRVSVTAIAPAIYGHASTVN